MAANIVDINACPNKTISLSIHVILDTADLAMVTPIQVNASIATLNQNFKPMCVQFKVCNYDSVPENIYFEKTAQDYLTELTTKYNIPNTINIYYSATVSPMWGSLDQSRGLATSANDNVRMANPLFRDFILVSYDDISIITHLMGHYFGLYDTFNNTVPELANGSNCKVAGDSICDTEADPGTFNANMVNCHLTSPTQDANGEYYTPPVCNHMSFYPAGCVKYFTPEQFNRMLSIFYTKRKYLW